MTYNFKLSISVHCSYLARTDPADVARVEGKTFICTDNKYDTVAHVKDGVQGIIGRWMSPEDMSVELEGRFPGCMTGECHRDVWQVNWDRYPYNITILKKRLSLHLPTHVSKATAKTHSDFAVEINTKIEYLFSSI